jgi:hypothetical protein
MRRHGAWPWRMSAADYSAGGHVRLVGTQQPTLRDLELGQVMAATGYAVYEETVADPLIADMSAGPNCQHDYLVSLRPWWRRARSRRFCGCSKAQR